MIECNLKEPFEIDGATYDPATLQKLHSAWTPMLWATETLYRAGDGAFLCTCHSPILHRRNRGHVIAPTRLGAIDIAIKLKAPDSVLRELGVMNAPGPDRPAPLDRSHRDTILLAASHPLSFWYECLYYNHDGSYVKSRLVNFSPLPYYQDFNRVISQREAIRYVLRRERAESALKILGVAI